MKPVAAKVSDDVLDAIVRKSVLREVTVSAIVREVLEREFARGSGNR